MIISDLYKTMITCSSYTLTIDSSTNIVYVKLLDFSNQPVIGKKVTLNVDKGRFSHVTRGSNSSISSNGKTVSAITTNQGEIGVAYVASEWGLCTFTCNDSVIQCDVVGWKQVQSLQNGQIIVYSNGRMGRVNLYGSFNITFGKDEVVKVIATIDSKYAPVTATPPQQPYPSLAPSECSCWIDSDGTIKVYKRGGNGKTITQQFYPYFTYPLNI